MTKLFRTAMLHILASGQQRNLGLSRWNVVSLPERLANERAAMQLNYLAALAFSYNFLGLDIRKIDNTIRVEIQYNLVRRHSNQETLGLCFDMLLKCKEFH